KIVGPGNAFVNEAKRQVFGDVGIDSLAGPSEVVVLADDSASPEFVARDLLAQAEHDPDARAILVTTSERLANATHTTIEKWLPGLSRKEILEKSLNNQGAIILVADISEGAHLVNRIAPEHLQVMTENPQQMLPLIRNAGAIFLGEFSPVAVGDYFAGANHVLPTAATARFASPLSVFDFVKSSSLVQYSKQRFGNDAEHIARFAELEGLINHKLAIECRNER
ncbi:MAG TPA: histidinol dehydrogenase, partial [bacterium]